MTLRVPVRRNSRSTYYLYDVDARCMVSYDVARKVCQRKGLALAPWAEPASRGELRAESFTDGTI
jgi:hypothetical protein